MSSEIIGIFGLGLLFLLIACGAHIGVALSLVGFSGILIVGNVPAALALMGFFPYRSLAVFAFVTLPLFILMGEFAHYSGVSQEAFNTSYKWLGHLRGGLAIATTAASALFAACCGSSIAATATMARVALPELDKFGYNKGFSCGLIAASGCLSALIPPSAVMLLYAMLTQQSLVKLLLAGLLPGILTACGYASVIYILVRINPKLGPRGPHFTWKEKIQSSPGVAGILLIVLFVLGGMYAGIFTATEAGATGAFLSFIMALLRKKLNWDNLRQSLQMTGVMTSSVFFVVLGAFIFGKFLALSGLTSAAVRMASSSALNPLIILVGTCIVFMILGTVLEVASMLAVTLPVVMPVILSLGYDPIWFGVIVVKLSEMGVITPPVGLNVYAIKGVVGDSVPLEAIFKNVLPFLLMDFITISILIAFPQISLFVPFGVFEK